MLKENYEAVLARIQAACQRSGRNPEDVTLIAVSKTKTEDALMEIYGTGERDFGENYVQELCTKYDDLPKDIRWHMIGHLQRNKVKYLIDKVCLIHSVDSIRLAETIHQEAGKRGIIMPILIEVNVGEEESKFGVSLDEAEALIREISPLSNVHVSGLMTSAPYVEDPELNRELFKKLKKLSVDITNKNINNVSMDIISMGMTNDYEIAVEEGATLVRVGTAIFGARDYGKNVLH